MAEQDSLSPYPPASAPYIVAAPVPVVPRYELRPLSVGEILDRVFSLYRSHFWLFSGLSALSASISVVLSIIRLVGLHFFPMSAASPTFLAVNSGIGFLQLAVYLIAYSLTSAATMSAVNSLYLGEPTSLRIALHTAKRLWLRCLGIAFWQTWSAVWVFVVSIPLYVGLGFLVGKMVAGAVLLALLFGLGLIASIVYGVIAYLRNSLAVPAAVVEDLRVRTAIRRSKNLATGRIGRIFLLILLVYALWVIAAVVETPILFLLLRSKATEQLILQGVILAINFLATSVVGPIGAIGLCLFYFDERVRREGFDIELLLRSASAANPWVPSYAPPPPEIFVAPQAIPQTSLELHPAPEEVHPAAEQT